MLHRTPMMNPAVIRMIPEVRTVGSARLSASCRASFGDAPPRRSDRYWSLSRVFGVSVFFMCYLICLSIQMGATIDYGILLSDQYRMIRRGGTPPEEALRQALGRALPTVLTSGIILIVAGFIIGIQCSIYYISSIGLLISRGAAMSVLLVLTLLPALLAVFDRRIMRKGGRR